MTMPRIRILAACCGAVLLPVLCLAQEKAKDTGPGDDSAIRVGIRDFRKLDGSKRLDALESTLPHLLRAGLFSYPWLEVSLLGKAAPAALGSRTSGEAQELSAGNDPFDLLIEGEFIEVSEDRIRIDYVVTDVLRRGEVFSDSLNLEIPQIVPAIGEASDRMAATLREKVLLPRTANRMVVIAGPFDKNFTETNLSFLSTQVPLAISASAEKSGLRRSVVVRPVTPGRAAGGANEKWDVQLTGRISVVNSVIQFAGTYKERTGLALPIEHSGPAGEPLRVVDGISGKVLEVLSARLAPKGGFREEPVLFANASAQQLFTRAQELEKSGDRDAALLLFGLALRKKPDDPAARLRIADIYRDRDSFDQAEELYRQVLAQSEQNADAHFGLGVLYIRRGNYDRAVQELELASSLVSGNPKLQFDTLMRLGDVYLRMKQPDRSIQVYLQAEGTQNPGSELYLALSKAYRAKKDLEGAVNSLNKGSQLWPADKALKNEMASVLNDQGRQWADAKEYSKALESYQKSIDLDPPDARLKAAAHVRAGIILGWELDDYNKAIGYLESAVLLDPGEEFSLRVLGMAYRQTGKNKESVDALKKAIAISPEFESYYQVAIAYRSLSLYDLGIESMNKALALEPRSAKGLSLLGALYQSRFQKSKDPEDYRLGVENLKQSIELDPQREDTHRILGIHYYNGENYENAVSSLQHAIKVKPTNWSYARMGAAYQKLGQVDEAIAAYKEAVKLDRRNESYYASLESLYAQGKQSEKFAEYLKEISQLDRRFIFPLIKLGILSLNQKRYEEAVEVLNRALAINANDEWALRVMGVTHTEIGKRDQSKTAYETALSFLNRAIQSRPTKWGYRQLGTTYAAYGDEQKAVAGFVKAIELDRTYDDAYEGLEPLYDKTRRAEEFNRLLETAVAKNPDYYWGRLALARRYNLQDRYDQALEQAQKAVELRPKEAGAYEQLGSVQLNQQDFSSAYENARKALALNPESGYAVFLIAESLFGQKLYKRAASELQPLTNPFPQWAFGHAVLGDAFRRDKAFSQAYLSSKKALALDAKHSYGHWVLGQTFFDEKKYRDAAATAREGLKSSPENSRLLSLFHNSSHKLGEDRQTAEFLEQLLAANPQSTTLLAAAGFVYHEYTKEHEKAFDAFRRAYDLNPTDPSIIQNYAEANLTTGRLDAVLKLTSEALAMPNSRPQSTLSMKLFQICAFLLQGEQGRAFAELGLFRDQYRKVPKDYDRSWTFEGTRDYFQAHTGLKPAEKALLLRMVDLLEAKQSEADAKLKQFEASFAKLFNDLKVASTAEKASKND